MWIYAIVIVIICVLCSVISSLLTARFLTFRYLKLLDTYTGQMLELMKELLEDVFKK